eukprot:CAMPEP_0172156606 /NCGR_PEP_ID=MMETSP1050-20130122/3312_1 /TAXON_ID=233186 /ORGANISM="Cryptomonas curvata, Strain CCAP979/52" /LENGTH=109 /DNA_ID=CAMNT_0012825709 /DNA_START=680 /DNA_END=1006 /DNA_ORIENTATION=+
MPSASDGREPVTRTQPESTAHGETGFSPPLQHESGSGNLCLGANSSLHAVSNPVSGPGSTPSLKHRRQPLIPPRLGRALPCAPTDFKFRVDSERPGPGLRLATRSAREH